MGATHTRSLGALATACPAARPSVATDGTGVAWTNPDPTVAGAGLPQAQNIGKRALSQAVRRDNGRIE
jgi:hypothetical protein